MLARHILMVDDARSERVLLRQTLSDVRRGLTVHEADSGEQALELFHRHPVDIVFLDIMLAGRNGLEVLSAIREHDPFAFVVMVSHHSRQDLVVKAIRFGAASFIVKPFSIARITDLFAQFERGAAYVPTPA